MGLTLEEARRRIDGILDGYRRSTGEAPRSVLPASVTAGKTYEAWVLCAVLERLRSDEGYDITLHESTRVVLKSAAGPINDGYAHFRLDQPGRRAIEVWTDVEFVTLSADLRGIAPGNADPCDYHELDLVAVPRGTRGRPRHDQVLLGIECKNVGYEKDMLRSLLGLRRELSFLQAAQPTGFRNWPRAHVPAHPPSCLMGYSTDSTILSYAGPAEMFGVDVVHEPLP